MAQATNRIQGVCKFFSSSKGYGFLTGQDGQDYFCHFSSLQIEGFKTLEDGQEVEFEIVDAPKGKAAVNVTVL